MAAKVSAWAAAGAALVLGWVGLAMPDDGPPAGPAPRPSPPRRVAVRLLGPAEAITGIEAPKGVARRNGTYLHARDPADVTVRLPGGRAARVWSKLTSVHVDHGVVVDVDLLPLPEAVPFREAVAELRRLMREMGIEPDERMREQMAAWPDDSGYFTYRTGVNLSESVKFSVDVRPTPDDNKFYLALMFSAIGDAQRAVWDPSFKATSKPSADEPTQKQ